MSVGLVHIRASKELLSIGDRFNIINKHDFIYGSVFPDALWIKDVHSTIKSTRSRLHYSSKNEPWNMPNILRFYLEYHEELRESDFLKGYLFHLLLDIENNIFWGNIIDESKTIITYKGKNIVCKSIDDMYRHKYLDAIRYGNEINYENLTSNDISLATVRICKEKFKVSTEDIQKSLDTVKETKEFNSTLPDGFSIDNEDYENIINKAIESILFIGNIEHWDKV